MTITVELIRVYRRRHLAARLGVSVPTIDRWAKRGRLPPPMRNGRMVGWRESVVEQWLADREARAPARSSAP
jgi:excisionase family DNA binding protein